HRKMLTTKSQDWIFLRIDLLIAILEVNPNTGVHQEDSKHIENPVEALNQYGAYANEDTAEDDRPEYSPEEYLVIVSFVNLEVAQDKEDHKDVVDRKRILGKIS